MVDEQEEPNRQDEARGEERAPIPQYVTHIDTMRGTINIGSTVHNAPVPAPSAGAPDDAGYHVAAIRLLLLEAFTAQELARFCRDRPRFKAVTYRFGPNHGMDDMVDEVIEYCSTRFLWEELLAAVQEANPTQYARFEADLRITSTSSPRAEVLPGAMLDDLQRRVRDYAPAALRSAAVGEVSAFRAALAAHPLDLARVEAAWRWFDEELPALSGPVLSVVLALGRHLQAGTDDELWVEFQDRFADIMD